MTFSVSVNKDKSADPRFILMVSIYGASFKVVNAEVELLRVPPRVSIHYPDEIQRVLSHINQKKLELEMLNKVVEHIMQNSERTGINTTVFYGKKG